MKLASEQEPVTDCTNCSTTKPRYYLFKENKTHDLIAGPENKVEDLYIDVTGRKRAHKGEVVKVPVGTVVVSEKAAELRTASRSKTASRAGSRSTTNRRSRAPKSPTRSRKPTNSASRPSPSASPTAAATPSTTSPGRSPSAARRRRSAWPAGEEAEALSGHFAVVLDNEVKTRPIINFAENPDGIDGRTGAQISGGFKDVFEAQDIATILQIGALPVDLKLISQTQVSATLGTQALHDGIKAGVIGLIAGDHLPAALLPRAGRDRGRSPSAPTG